MLPVDILDSLLFPTESGNNLGKWFNSDFLCKLEVNTLACTCVDYCNSPFKSSRYVNCNVSETVQFELYQTLVDAPV